MSQRRRSTALTARIVAMALAAAVVPVLLLQSPAAAAAWGVSSTADTPIGQGCAGFTGCSLREAITSAEANPGADAILISAGTYTLSNGPLAITQDLTLDRVGAGAATIDGGGGTALTISGPASLTLRFLRITGADSAPAVVSTGGASVTVETTTITDNDGGGITSTGGSLAIRRAGGSITDSVLSDNTTAGEGGAVAFTTDDPGDSLAISNTTFSNNSAAQAGGAISVRSQAGAMTLIDRTTFSGNTAGSFGGALFQLSGSLRLTHSTVVANTAAADGGAIFHTTVDSDTYTYNRFYGNDAPDDDVSLFGGTLDLQRNWWGCNAGPGVGCETVHTNVGTVADTDPWLVFGTSGPASVQTPNGTAPITAGITADSNGDPVSTTDLDMLDGTSVTWSALPAAAAIGSPTSLDDTGVTSTTYSAMSAPAGPGSATATLDGQSVTAAFTLLRSPSSTVALEPFAGPFTYGRAVRATATVSGPGGGAVQFLLDGAQVGSPVPLSGGSATGPDLTPEPGEHVVTATYLPPDPAEPTSSVSRSLHVDKAATTTTPSVAMVTLSAAVAVVAPGGGTPDGEVAFTVDGEPVGTAPVVDGTAELVYPVPGGDHTVTAAYSGSARYAPSDGTTTRSDPILTATVTSRVPPTSFGWYRTPVRITFTCEETSAPLAGPCPAPVRLTASAPRIHVDQTIGALDGGYASVTVVVSLDRRDPTLRVRTTRTGQLRCVARDRLSGIDTCTITTTRRGFKAVAVDKAGNRAVVRGPRRR